MGDLVERLRARTFSRWESDIQAVMDYEDELCTEAAAEIEKLRRERDHWETAFNGAFETALSNERDRKAAEAKVAEMRAALQEARQIVDACVHQEVPTLGWANEVLAAIDRALAAREGAET